MYTGGLFDAGVGSVDDGGYVSEETAFRYAIERINHNHQLFNNTRLSPEYEKIHPTDSFRAANRGGGAMKIPLGYKLTII